MESTDQLRQAHALLAARTFDRRHHGEDPGRPETVQAMQIALHIPKPILPRRQELFAAAGTAVVKVCLDPRVVSSPEYRAALQGWYDHLIRKVARRARNRNWEQAQAIPGVTAQVGTAQARAFLPGPVFQIPPELKKLQISGTELPREEDPCPVDQRQNPQIYIDAGLGMSTGKTAAQVGHAAMLLAARKDFNWVQRWAQRDFALTVCEIDSDRFYRIARDPSAIAVRDAGFTEVAPDSLTVFALPGEI